MDHGEYRTFAPDQTRESKSKQTYKNEKQTIFFQK